MTFPEHMLYGGGLRDGAIPLRLANYPPVITCFRRFLGAHGRERATAAVAARRRPHPRARGMAAHAEAAPRAGSSIREPVAVAAGSGGQRGWGRSWGYFRTAPQASASTGCATRCDAGGCPSTSRKFAEAYSPGKDKKIPGVSPGRVSYYALARPIDIPQR